MNAARPCINFFSSCVIVMGEKDKFSPKGGQALLKKWTRKLQHIFLQLPHKKCKCGNNNNIKENK